MDRRPGARGEHGAPRPTPPEVVVAVGEVVEGDERCRRLLGEHPDARRRRMDPDQERVEVEAALGTGDDHLAVQHEPGVRAAQGQERPVELGEVSVQRLQVAGLEVDIGAVTEDEGAKPSHFGS